MEQADFDVDTLYQINKSVIDSVVQEWAKKEEKIKKALAKEAKFIK